MSYPDIHTLFRHPLARWAGAAVAALIWIFVFHPQARPERAKFNAGESTVTRQHGNQDVTPAAVRQGPPDPYEFAPLGEGSGIEDERPLQAFIDVMELAEMLEERGLNGDWSLSEEAMRLLPIPLETQQRMNALLPAIHLRVQQMQIDSKHIEESKQENISRSVVFDSAKDALGVALRKDLPATGLPAELLEACVHLVVSSDAAEVLCARHIFHLTLAVPGNGGSLRRLPERRSSGGANTPWYRNAEELQILLRDDATMTPFTGHVDLEDFNLPPRNP